MGAVDAGTLQAQRSRINLKWPGLRREAKKHRLGLSETSEVEKSIGLGEEAKFPRSRVNRLERKSEVSGGRK